MTDTRHWNIFSKGKKLEIKGVEILLSLRIKHLNNPSIFYCMCFWIFISFDHSGVTSRRIIVVYWCFYTSVILGC